MSHDVSPGAALPVGSDGSWSAGRVVTLVVPLARSLAVMHMQGLVHGAVGRYAVRCTAEGRPEFVDGSGSHSRSAAATAEADVRALARLGLQLLDPTSEGGERARATLDAAAAGRLDAAGLADQLSAVTRAEPLLAVAGPVTPTSHRRPPQRGRTPRLRRGLLAGCVAAAGLAAFAVAATASNAPGSGPLPVTETAATDPTATDIAASTPEDVDWADVVERLTAARVVALTNGDPKLLGRIYVAGARPAASDAALLRRWRAQHRRAVGLDATVVSVTPVRIQSDAAVVEVTTTLSGYRVVDQRGITVARAAEQRQTVRLMLVRRDERWLVRQVRPAARQSTSAATAASTSS